MNEQGAELFLSETDSDSSTAEQNKSDQQLEEPSGKPNENPLNVTKDLNQKQLDKLIEDKMISAKNSDMQKKNNGDKGKVRQSQQFAEPNRASSYIS